MRLGEGEAGARNEVFRPDQSLRSRYREDFWWKLRLFIPHDWPPGDLPVSFITVMQIIGGTTQLGWDPDFKLRIDCDNTWHWDGPGSRRLGPITRGAWTEWLVRYWRSTGPDGLAQVWQDERLVVDAHGRTTFASLPTANWKYGIYTAVAPSPRAYVRYFDDVQVSTEPLVPGGGRCHRGGGAAHIRAVAATIRPAGDRLSALMCRLRRLTGPRL